KVKFLTVIWGARYIDEFARISLPSYLAPGNLPALAAASDLEILMLTSRESIAAFDGKPAFERLRQLCPVRFLPIDDLITSGCYGVTLTLAYARGIADSGAAQTDTTFVFMNSDFVLAEGALETLLTRLHQGHRCVMAPSLRARAEDALPVLADAIDPRDGSLAMPPRAMVRLAFDTLHPTVVAKTVTQQLVTCTTHNQIYWQVDGTALLARYHLIFMLAIRPERPIGRVNSYCDYGLVPELVPSGAFTILDDSDSFFMLELQPSDQERRFISSGAKRPAEIARELSVWTTREHRRFAEADVLFRTADPPDGLDEARRHLAGFMAAVRSRMTRRPADHEDHLYWTLGVAAWRSLRAAGGDDQVEPPELASPAAARTTAPRGWLRGVAARRRRGRRVPLAQRLYTGLLARARRAMGSVPDVPIWHHLWPDSRLLLDWVEALPPADHRLLVCADDSTLAAALGRGDRFEVRTGFDALLEDIDADLDRSRAQAEGYGVVLLHLHRADVLTAGRLIEAARQLVRPGGAIAIYIDHPNGDADPSNFTIELAHYTSDLFLSGWLGCRVAARFAGGRIKRRLRRLERRVLNQLWPSSWTRLPLLLGAMVLWPVVAALTAANNLRMGRPSEVCPAYCTSALIVLSGLETGRLGAPRPDHAGVAPAPAAAEAHD
uniref:hypothetical protein n=1 Tax=Elioraea sp. TaxID=2185103 RepID=UPI003F714D9A